MEESQIFKSPINYVGNKHRLIPALLSLFPKNIDVFVDMFAGSGTVFLNTKAKRYWVNDIQSEIIALHKYFYQHALSGAGQFNEKILMQIKRFKLDEESQGEEIYYALRRLYNQTKKPYLLFILSNHSFSTSIRFNQKGFFNAPFAKSEDGKRSRGFNKARQENLKHYFNSIEKKPVQFFNKSFEEIDTRKLNHDDFVYFDPPYLISAANYNSFWNEEKEAKLLEKLKELDKQGVKFGLSNLLSNNGKENHILKKWLAENPQFYCHQLTINYGNCFYSKKSRKNSAVEVYICNYKL